MGASPSFTNAEWAQQLAAERALRERAETALAGLADIPGQNPNPILRLSPVGEVLYANAAAAPLLQALAADLRRPLRQHLLELVPPADQAQPQALALADEHYQVRAVAGQDSVTLYLINDTARHHSEQQCTFYESVLAQVPTAIAVFDAGHRYLFLNFAAEPDHAIRARMLGLTSTEACAFRHRSEAVTQQRVVAFAKAVAEQSEVAWEEADSGWTGRQQLLLRYRPVLGPDDLLWVIASAADITERKEAETIIARQREFYESILNLLPVDVAVFDADHRFLFANSLSISDPVVRQQVIGLTSAEYFALRQHAQPAGLADQREQYFELAARTLTDVMWEEMRTDRSQRPQLMLRHLRPVSNPDGTLRLMVGAGINITARYLAESLQNEVQDMLREQEVFIRQIVDALPNVLYLVEPGENISFSNRAFRERVNESAHLTGAEPKLEVVAGEIADMRALNLEVLRTGQPITREMPVTLNTGEQRHNRVYVQPLRRANGQMGVLTISIDITEMKRALQELERREKQYHDLVYYSQALICTHDLAGKLLTVNPAIERLMGVPAAQLVGLHLRDALPPEHCAILQACLDGDEVSLPQPRVISVRNKAGELRYLNYYTYKVAEEGYPAYVVASGYDVTSGVLAQRALQHAKQEAEENAHAKESFLARMSHEIRTPLNGVLGMAGLLQKTELTAAQREYLNTMQHAGRHLLALLNDVLDMAKISAHHLQLNQDSFDVAVALHGAGQAVAALAAEKGLTLEVEPPDSALPRVLGDAYRLHQVLLNLLGNALKFTESGSVRLGAAVCPSPAHEAVVRFWVEDTGIGMTPAEQDHIFEAFAQANNETSRRFGGTGLGLSISQQLVVQMGSTLHVCSEPGRGTTFSFQLTLPHAPAAVPAARPGPLPAVSYEGLRGLRVLLAEDNLVNQWIAVVVLEHWGMQVHAVSNGIDALARLQKERFDVAILDIRMPGLNGVEVTQAIRRHPEAAHANIPVIALTANAFEADLVAYLAAGMNACLTKPYEEAELCQLLLALTAT